MPNTVTRYTNEHRYEIEGQIDLNSSAAVIAVRGTGLSAVKSATGTYTVTLAGPSALKLVEVLDQRSNFAGGAPVTALGTRISSITQTSTDTNDPITIVIKTTATAGGSGADTDGTAAVTLSFRVVLRVGKMTAWT